jgi:hypothetical protein
VKISKIISGGQTGVDRAALDIALGFNISCGGWCPKGRLAEDGVIPARYPLKETKSSDYEMRTEWNVRDSDGTLVLTLGKPTGGTAFTIECAKKYKKPCLVVNLKRHDGEVVNIYWDWIEVNDIKVLNIAGPRESKAPGIYELARKCLEGVLGY